MGYEAEKDYALPFFSIIIPAYNADKLYLAQCIDSLIKQTFPGFEIILVDDGSREDCVSFYDGIAASDSRITVIHQENKGVSAARNKGLSCARAPWIMFVDSDDWIELDSCERLYAYLNSAECEILMFSHIKEFSNGLSVKQKTGLVSDTLYKMDDIGLKERFYRRAMGTPNLGNDNLSTFYYSTDKVYSREFLLKNHLQFPEGLPKSEDKVFVLCCFERMHALLYQDDALYHYRINEQSASNKYSPYVDEERRQLSEYLEKIAKSMDAELAALTNDPEYHTIYSDYMRFVFGIISDVLFSKYYHKDYPYSNKQRNAEVKAFLESEPFCSAIAFCRYSDLGMGAKLKKYMLSHGMTTLFCEAKKTLYSLKGQISQ